MRLVARKYKPELTASNCCTTRLNCEVAGVTVSKANASIIMANRNKDVGLNFNGKSANVTDINYQQLVTSNEASGYTQVMQVIPSKTDGYFIPISDDASNCAYLVPISEARRSAINNNLDDSLTTTNYDYDYPTTYNKPDENQDNSRNSTYNEPDENQDNSGNFTYNEPDENQDNSGNSTYNEPDDNQDNSRNTTYNEPEDSQEHSGNQDDPSAYDELDVYDDVEEYNAELSATLDGNGDIKKNTCIFCKTQTRYDFVVMDESHSFFN